MLSPPPFGRHPAWPQAIIFDLDGTLVDTAPDIAAVLNRLLDELGLERLPGEAVRLMIGGGLGKLLDRALAAQNASLSASARGHAAARLVELYAVEPVKLSRAYPGAAEMLAELRAADIACGICTNKPAAISRGVLGGLGLIDAFACLQCGDGELPKKPDPAGLLQVARRLGAEPSAAVMVGDSAVDVQAARAAGFAAVILVSHGYTATPASRLGADKVIDSLAELLPALAGLAAHRSVNGLTPN